MSDFVLEGGGETSIVRGDSRTVEEREQAAVIWLNDIVHLLGDFHKRIRVVEKMETWLDGHTDAHELYAEREHEYEAKVDALGAMIGRLSRLSQLLESEVKGMRTKDSERFIKAWLIPWPCSFEVGLYDSSLDTTPWKDYCPF